MKSARLVLACVAGSALLAPYSAAQGGGPVPTLPINTILGAGQSHTTGDGVTVTNTGTQLVCVTEERERLAPGRERTKRTIVKVPSNGSVIVWNPQPNTRTEVNAGAKVRFGRGPISPPPPPPLAPEKESGIWIMSGSPMIELTCSGMTINIAADNVSISVTGNDNVINQNGHSGVNVATSGQGNTVNR